MPKTSIAFWRNSDLRKILTGELISDFGSQIGDLALPIFAATTLEASAAQMAGLLSAEYVPRIVVGLVAAGWIDRVRRRPVLICANLARFAVLALVALAAWRQVLGIEHPYIVAISMAGLDVLFISSFVAYLPSLVPTAMLTAANATRASSSAAAGVLGPALAGALISVVGAPAAIATDGVSFLASVAALVSVQPVERRPHRRLRQTHPVEAMRQGWEAMLREPTLRALAATAFTANFFYRVIMSVYVLYLTRDLGLSAATVGVIFGFGGGVGVLIGSVLAAPVAREFGVGRSMIVAHVLFGMLGVPLALPAFVPGYAAALVFASEFLQSGWIPPETASSRRRERRRSPAPAPRSPRGWLAERRMLSGDDCWLCRRGAIAETRLLRRRFPPRCAAAPGGIHSLRDKLTPAGSAGVRSMRTGCARRTT